MPATMVETEIIKGAVRTACRAPSLHNSQPWQWTLTSIGELQLFLDSSRVLPSDRSGREAVISCGAALGHLRVAMAATGWQAIVERFPNPNNPYHLASVHFVPMDFVTDGHHRRAGAIGERRSDRLPFAPPANWESFEPVLRNAIDRDDVRLDVLSDDVRSRLAQASQFTESLRLYDSNYHSELARWTAPFEFSEGIPYSSLVSVAERDRVDVGRVFPAAHHHERRTEIPEDHATVLVLSTDTDTRRDALATGEVLSTVLLESTMAGFATCPLTHFTELRVTREIVGRLVGDDDIVPQILVRVGLAPTVEQAPPPTPRRPLADVFQIASDRN
ncbi:NAD(P)H nitroreductase [Mycobacterium kyorinense]|uniref:NAD(P)H nitroreductase n=1 Tax=Mycobacterium kyorinense TaxID=487514 RepID=A0A1A2YQL1_9MYCO|nr:NAD(P)H nitroreductase [Mycobacterium kyorinense]OBI40290.1 NAD(P)H nitroreductase [Mycobacterium kyorinense]